MSLIFGTRAVEEAIEAGTTLNKVWAVERLDGAAAMVVGLARKQGFPIQIVPVARLDRLAKGSNHQGVVAEVAAVEYSDLETIIPILFAKKQVPLILALDRITDVRNMGGIARSALAAGVHALVVPKHRAAQASSDAMKASAGALAHLPVCRVDDLKKAVYYCKDQGLGVVGITEKSRQGLYETELEGPMVVILGSEEDGIRPELLRLCDATVSIPMAGPVGSLNVGAAATVALFEMARRRRAQNPMMESENEMADSQVGDTTGAPLTDAEMPLNPGTMPYGEAGEEGMPERHWPDIE